jgi:hypothetical protein
MTRIDAAALRDGRKLATSSLTIWIVSAETVQHHVCVDKEAVALSESLDGLSLALKNFCHEYYRKGRRRLAGSRNEPCFSWRNLPMAEQPSLIWRMNVRPKCIEIELFGVFLYRAPDIQQPAPSDSAVQSVKKFH